MIEHQDTTASPTGGPFPDTQRQLEFTPVVPPGTRESTLAQTPDTSHPPMHGNLQAKVNIMLRDINTANAEKMREHREKMEVQQQLNELAAKYDNLVKRLGTREAQSEWRQAASHHSQNTHGQQHLTTHVDAPLHPRELREGVPGPQPIRVEEQVAESGRQHTAKLIQLRSNAEPTYRQHQPTTGTLGAAGGQRPYGRTKPCTRGNKVCRASGAFHNKNFGRYAVSECKVDQDRPLQWACRPLPSYG